MTLVTELHQKILLSPTLGALAFPGPTLPVSAPQSQRNLLTSLHADSPFLFRQELEYLPLIVRSG